MGKSRVLCMAMAPVLAIILAVIGVVLAPTVGDVFGDETSYKAYAAKKPKLFPTGANMKIGTTVTVKVENADKKKVTWKSSNKKIATVSKNGKIKAKKVGSCTITAKVGKTKLTFKVTVRPCISKSWATLVKGKTITLKIKGVSKKAKVKWWSSNKKVATVSKTGKVKAKKVGKAVIKAKVGGKTYQCRITVVNARGSSSNNGSAPKPSNQTPPPDPQAEEQKKLVAQVSSYSYKITPINGTLNNLVFVETNNPDPTSFQLEDKKSKYLKSGQAAIYKPVPYRFSDVQYSNSPTLRIANKGYLFYCEECNSDGGALDLTANTGYFYDDNGSSLSYFSGRNYVTNKQVAVVAMQDFADYLINTYAAGKDTFWSKLGAVQTGLSDIALYPKPILDNTKPVKSYQYFASSPYKEKSWNAHIEAMFDYRSEGLFLDAAYGFVLNSSTFPGMMYDVAKRLDPRCVIKTGSVHYNINVTLDGTTHTYGGAGYGSTHPIYQKFVDWKFKFDGTDIGFGTNLSLETLKNARLNCMRKSDEQAAEYLKPLTGKSLTNVVGQGAWARIRYEGMLGGGVTIGYATMGPDGIAEPASNVWVDGRYINNNEEYEPNGKFSDHPSAGIILHDVSYVRNDGTAVRGDVIYRYSSATDDWRALLFYVGGYSFTNYDEWEMDQKSPNLVLSRAKVEAMVAAGQIDGNTGTPPKAGYIYDGSAMPGTYTSDLTKL